MKIGALLLFSKKERKCFMPKFIITNPDRDVFLGITDSGKMGKVSFENAMIFHSESRAKNLLANSLRLGEAECWVCIPYFESIFSQDVDESVSDTLNIISNLQREINIETKKLSQQRESFICKESLIDREISDIYHFIAFERVSVTKWSKIYKLLSEKLRERAETKNQLRVLNAALAKLSEGQSISNVIAENDDKDYVPRTYIYEMLKEL